MLQAIQFGGFVVAGITICDQHTLVTPQQLRGDGSASARAVMIESNIRPSAVFIRG